tara:strand:+ start:555 stop:770 length:216 start_codon:yes stop_codon:yes gene_type:complete
MEKKSDQQTGAQCIVRGSIIAILVDYHTKFGESVPNKNNNWIVVTSQRLKCKQTETKRKQDMEENNYQEKL